MMRKVLINIKIFFMINLLFNCLSINYLKLDEKKFQPKENSILYKIEDNQQFGNKHGLQKIVNVINSELYNSELIAFKETKQDKKYIYMVIKNNPPEPHWTKQLLLFASISTFSIIPFHDVVINKVQYEERENEKVMNRFEYEFELGICVSLFSLNCTFFHEEKFTFAPFFLERLVQEVYLKIGKEFSGKK